VKSETVAGNDKKVRPKVKNLVKRNSSDHIVYSNQKVGKTKTPLRELRTAQVLEQGEKQLRGRNTLLRNTPKNRPGLKNDLEISPSDNNLKTFND